MNLRMRFIQYCEGDIEDVNYPDSYTFSNCKTKLSKRPDVNALMILDSLIDGDKPFIDGDELSQYELPLQINLEELNSKISDEQIQDLICCGVRCGGGYDCLYLLTAYGYDYK